MTLWAEGVWVPGLGVRVCEGWTFQWEKNGVTAWSRGLSVASADRSLTFFTQLHISISPLTEPEWTEEKKKLADTHLQADFTLVTSV